MSANLRSRSLILGALALRHKERALTKALVLSNLSYKFYMKLSLWHTKRFFLHLCSHLVNFSSRNQFLKMLQNLTNFGPKGIKRSVLFMVMLTKCGTLFPRHWPDWSPYKGQASPLQIGIYNDYSRAQKNQPKVFHSTIFFKQILYANVIVTLKALLFTHLESKSSVNQSLKIVKILTNFGAECVKRSVLKLLFMYQTHTWVLILWLELYFYQNVYFIVTCIGHEGYYWYLLIP